MKFRDKTSVIEAYQFSEPASWTNVPPEFREAVFPDASGDGSWRISTPHGEWMVLNGDWIIKTAKGEFYPYRPEVFEAFYVAVGE